MIIIKIVVIVSFLGYSVFIFYSFVCKNLINDTIPRGETQLSPRPRPPLTDPYFIRYE